MPTKTAAKKVAASKKAAPAKTAKASKKAAAAEESSGSGRGGPDLKLANRIKKMRDNDQSWREIADELEIGTGKAMLLNLYARVDEDDRITGTDAAIAKKVVKARNDGYSWGALQARTGLGEQRLRKMYEEETGESTRGNRIGKGGRYPGDVKPDDEDTPKSRKAAGKKAPAKAAAPAKKAAKAAKAGKAPGAEKPRTPSVSEDPNSPLVAWPLAKLQERLDGKKITVVGDNDTKRTIMVRKITKKTKDGEITLTDQDGKTRTILAVHIKSATK